MAKIETLKPRREKTADERALELKASISEHLQAVAGLMNEGAKDNIEVTFNIGRNEQGAYIVTSLTLLRRY